MNSILNIKSFTDSHLAVSAKQGSKIYEELYTSIKNEKNIVLDFEGIELIITAFLNASIGKLYSEFTSEEIRKYLTIENLDPTETELLKLVLEHAKDRFNKHYPENYDNIDILNDDAEDYGA